MAVVMKAKPSTRSPGHRHREELVAPLSATTVPVSAVRKQNFRGSRLFCVVLGTHYAPWWVRILSGSKIFVLESFLARQGNF